MLHLGNGASASAIRGGQPIDTSMGMTPLQGLVMGTRSGDIDPGVVMHLHRVAKLSADQIDTLLNKQSGLKGLCGESDFRSVTALIEQGDHSAKLAYDVYVHRLRHCLGAYLLDLGRLDAICFTAGVGENAAGLRADTLTDLENFGIILDPGEIPCAPRKPAGSPPTAVLLTCWWSPPMKNSPSPARPPRSSPTPDVVTPRNRRGDQKRVAGRT